MARALAWALAAVAAAQTSPKALAESTLVPNATNASTTCDVIVRIGYPEGLAPYAVAAPTRWVDGDGACFTFLPRTVNGTGHTDPSEFCATSI